MPGNDPKQRSGPTPIALTSPAKINLFLKVTGRRDDGYHELETLMVCIDLFDTIRLTVGGGSISVRCQHPQVPEDQRNLAAKAAGLFFQNHGRRDGVLIEIQKQIPVGAGLGGGSSNAACVLNGLNRHFGSPFSKAALAEMALAIGADVPFFIYGKPALATGIGERLEPYGKLSPFSLLVLYPGFAVATATVYKNLNLGLTKDEIPPKYFPLMTNFAVEHHLCNDLEAVTLQRHPEIAAAKDSLMDHGAKGALMSGSGSCVFGIFADADRARRAGRSISAQGQYQVFETRLLI